MHYSFIILLTTSLSIGFIHTLMGPDHYIPFIAMSKARHWSVLKTTVITIFCGIAHVGSAVFLAILGASMSIAITKLNIIESFRGSLAAWFLIAFGLVYCVWGLRRALKHTKHSHWHMGPDGKFYRHGHGKDKSEKKTIKEITPWILFTIFILGPCEPVIPLIMYPAIRGWTVDVFVITLFFGIATIAVMLFMVLASVFGMNCIRSNFLEKYGNALAGAIICASGLAIKFLGL